MPGDDKATSILLVEDNVDTATTLAELLSMRGYNVRAVHSIREALKQLDGTQLIISDLGLPDGTGIDLMKNARVKGPVKAIALSGYNTEEDQRKSREAGFAAHLTKPVDLKTLLATIEHVATGEPS